MEKMSKQKPDPKRLEYVVKNGEKKVIFLMTWHDHVKAQHLVKAYIRILDHIDKNGNLVHQGLLFEPKPDELFIPFSEFHGSYDECYIIIYNTKLQKEIRREDIKNIDTIHWEEK